MLTRTWLTSLLALAFVGCDSNPTPHPQESVPRKPDTCEPGTDPMTGGDTYDTETDTARGDIPGGFEDHDVHPETTDTDAGPSPDNSCYSCAGELDDFSTAPPTGPR